MRIAGWIGIVAATLGAAPSRAAPSDQSRTVFATVAQKGPGWFICDGVADAVVLLVGRPGKAGLLSIGVLDIAHPAAPPIVTSYRVGGPDPGAGQVYWPLTGLGKNGGDAGFLHAFNPGAYGDETAVRTPPFTEVKLGEHAHACRWLANTRFNGVGLRRTIAITRAADGLVYESYDYAARPLPPVDPDGAQRTTKPSQRLTGGRETPDGHGGTTLRFASGGYRYVVAVPVRGAASISVLRNGRPIRREALIAYTLGPR